jgi:hypothetical protein
VSEPGPPGRPGGSRDRRQLGLGELRERPRARADFEALLEVLDPDVVLRADCGAVSIGASRRMTLATAIDAGEFCGSQPKCCSVTG